MSPGRNGYCAANIKEVIKGFTTVSDMKRLRKLCPISKNLLIGSQCVTREEVEVGIYFIILSADLGGSL